METYGATDNSERISEDLSITLSSTLSSQLSDQAVTPDEHGTTAALNRCKGLLQMYKTYLKVIGWHNFVEDPSFKIKFLRVLWTFVLLVFILFALSTQATSCFQRDLFNSIDTAHSNFCGENDKIDKVIRCDINFVSIYVIPAILQFATYIYGIYLFRGKWEYLESLAEQVFLNLRNDLQNLEEYVVIRIILYFCLAIIFIIISLIVRIFHAVVYKMFDDNVAICWKDFRHLITGKDKDILLVSSLTGFVFLDGVYTSAVINYAIHSELNISMLRSVGMKVRNRGYANFDAAIQDVHKAYECVIVLNGKTATLVALVLFNFVSHTIRDIITLGGVLFEDPTHITVLTFSAMLWAFLAIFPFIQATRVSRACTNLLAVGSAIRVRPYQYKETSQLDLDSFCIYLSSIINMRAEIFGVPIFPWMANMVAISFAFVMLLLCQDGVYQYAKWM